MAAHICHFSLYALDPAWPLDYQVIVDALNPLPEAHTAVGRAVTAFVEKIKGRRALLPRAAHSARHSNEPHPLPRVPDLGSRA